MKTNMNPYLSVYRNDYGQKQVFEEYDSILNSLGLSFEEINIPTCLGSTHVILAGQPEKPPLILIHAFYATAVSWYLNLKILSENFRVYAVDIIGDPNKSRPIKLIRQLNDFVDWFNDLLDSLHLEHADFVGNSVGAFHVANFALHAPKRVNKMILIGPAATFLKITPFYFNTFPGGMTGWTFLVRHAVNWIENGVPFESRFRKLFYLNLKYGKSANQVFPSVLKDEELEKIDTPTLLIYGKKEVIYNCDLAIDRAQKHMRKITVKIIPDANHITAASNSVLTNNTIIEFLKDGK